MEHLWIVLHPLALPVAVAAAGGVVGFVLVGKYRERLAPRHTAIAFGLIVLSAFAAWVPNAGQQLYELGISFPTIEVLQAASYFLFALGIVGAWKLLERSWQRWSLMLLVPVSFAQPLLWTWAYISWTVWGFAP